MSINCILILSEPSSVSESRFWIKEIRHESDKVYNNKNKNNNIFICTQYSTINFYNWI